MTEVTATATTTISPVTPDIATVNTPASLNAPVEKALAGLQETLTRPDIKFTHPLDAKQEIPFAVSSVKLGEDLRGTDGNPVAAQFVLDVKGAQYIDNAALRKTLDRSFKDIPFVAKNYSLPGTFNQHKPSEVGQLVDKFMGDYSVEALAAKGLSAEQAAKGFSSGTKENPGERDLILSAHIFDDAKHDSYHTYAVNGANAMTVHMDFPKDVPAEEITGVMKEISGRMAQVCAYMQNKVAPAYNAKIAKFNEKHPDKAKPLLTAEQIAVLGKLSTITTESTNENGTHLVYHFGVAKPGASAKISIPSDFGPNPLAALDLDMEKFALHALTFAASTEAGKETSWTNSFADVAGPAQIKFWLQQKAKEIEKVLPKEEVEKMWVSLKALVKENTFRDFQEAHSARKPVNPMLSYHTTGDVVTVSVPFMNGIDSRFELLGKMNDSIAAKKLTVTASVETAITDAAADKNIAAAQPPQAESKIQQILADGPKKVPTVEELTAMTPAGGGRVM